MSNDLAELGSVDVPNKHILNYRWRERKTSSSLFMRGCRLPLDAKEVELAVSLLEERDTNFIYQSPLTEDEIISRYLYLVSQIRSQEEYDREFAYMNKRDAINASIIRDRYVWFLSQIKDPKDYDLIYHSSMTEEIMLKRYELVQNNGTSPLVNKRFKDLLQEICPDDVQFFPATIVNADDKMEPFENHDYYVLNICRKVDALDFDKTEFKLIDKTKPRSPSNVMSPRNRVYKSMDQIEPFGIARLLYFSPDIILPPHVAEAVQKAKIKGLRLWACS